MSDTEEILVTKEGAVLHLRFNRPQKRNALNQATWNAIPRVIDQVENDDSLAVLVISGEGDHFCAGADISEFGAVRSTPERAAEYGKMVEAAEARLAHCTKPTIAAIDGFCIGGGLEVALACDFRIMAAEARSGITASKIGIVYGAPSTRRLVDIAGAAAARYILYSANLVNADKALQLGLATDVVATGQALDAAKQLAETLASRSPYTIRGAKRIIDHYLASSLTDEALDITGLTKDAVNSDFYQHAVRAFNSK